MSQAMECYSAFVSPLKATPNYVNEDLIDAPNECFQELDQIDTFFNYLTDGENRNDIKEETFETPAAFTMKSLDPTFDFQKSFNIIETQNDIEAPVLSIPEPMVDTNDVMVFEVLDYSVMKPKISKSKTFNPRKLTLNLDNLHTSNNCIFYEGRQIVIGQDAKTCKYLGQGNLLQLIIWLFKETLPDPQNYTLTGRIFNGKDHHAKGAKTLPKTLKNEIRRFLIETELLKYEECIVDLDTSMHRVYTKAFNVIRDAENARLRSRRQIARKHL